MTYAKFLMPVIWLATSISITFLDTWTDRESLQRPSCSARYARSEIRIVFNVTVSLKIMRFNGVIKLALFLSLKRRQDLMLLTGHRLSCSLRRVFLFFFFSFKRRQFSETFSAILCNTLLAECAELTNEKKKHWRAIYFALSAPFRLLTPIIRDLWFL